MLQHLKNLFAVQVNLPENELNDFLHLATELQLKGVEVSEDQKSQFEESSTKSGRKKPITSKDIKTENSKIVPPPETMKPKNIFQGNASLDENPNTSDYIDKNTIVVKFKEKNPVLEEKIQSFLERSDNMWTCNVCGKTNKKLNKTRKHVETHIEGFSHLCPHCEKICKTSNGLEVHVKTKHEESFYVSTGGDAL